MLLMARSFDGTHVNKAAVRRTATKNNGAPLLLLAMALSCVGACTQPAVRPSLRTADRDLPRPVRIRVTNFAANELDVMEYQGIFRQQPSNPNSAERRRAIARNVSEALSLQLVRGLKELGFSATRGTPGVSDEEDTLIIEGEIVRIDEGSPLQRWAVGFGSGAAKVQTRARVVQGSQRRKLLEFSTDADSGKLPGAAVTASAGALAPPIVGAGVLTGNALANGFQNRADVSQLARSTADQTVRYLAEFFVRQGWIQSDQVKKARIGY